MWSSGVCFVSYNMLPCPYMIFAKPSVLKNYLQRHIPVLVKIHIGSYRGILLIRQESQKFSSLSYLRMWNPRRHPDIGAAVRQEWPDNLTLSSGLKSNVILNIGFFLLWDSPYWIPYCTTWMCAQAVGRGLPDRDQQHAAEFLRRSDGELDVSSLRLSDLSCFSGILGSFFVFFVEKI